MEYRAQRRKAVQIPHTVVIGHFQVQNNRQYSAFTNSFDTTR
jgi:hypothetical protein